MKRLDLLNFIPETMICHEGKGQEVKLNHKYDNEYISLSYVVKQYNNAQREHSLTIKRFISESNETFEILGLLQAEMGKTQNGCLTFANSEAKIIRKVMNWFEKDLEIGYDLWRWYIKLNINEPKDVKYKKEIESKVLNHWLKKTKISLSSSYPKSVTYIKNTKNKLLWFYDYGTLILEYKNNVFSQIIKNFIRSILLKITSVDKEFIRSYLRGVIAGEGTVELSKQNMKYRIHISVTKEDEKYIYYKCLSNLGIKSKKYKGDKLVISKRENHIQLLKQRLMTLHPKKYNRFLYMIQQYPSISYETGYFTGNKKIWNKISQDKIDGVIELYESGLTRTKDIAEKVGVSVIKVNRVLKEHNLGKRLINTPESKRKEIAKFVEENKKLTQKQIANNFRVHESVVRRAYKKYCIANISYSIIISG